LNKQPAASPATEARRPPVRRADPAKRSRVAAPAKPANSQSSVRDEKPVPARGEKPGHSARAPSRGRDATGRDTPRRGGKQRDGFEPGEFNRDRKTNPKFSPRPVAGNPDMPRLSKRMAELGLCSRREADEWIVNGWVKVNGVVTDT